MSFVLCEDTDENGETCGRNSTLEVLKEVKKVYEERLKRIDEEACGNGTQLKLRTLQSWIIDLENQNTSLIHVVEQLEQEAKACLCKTPCPVTGVNVPLGRDEEIEKLTIELNDLNMKLSQFKENENNQKSELLLLRKEIMAITEDNKLKENQIQGFITRFKDLSADIENRSKQEVSEFKGNSESIDTVIEQCYTDLQVSLRNALHERNVFANEIQRCTKEIEQYRLTINEQENEIKKMYEILNSEISEKQNQIFILQRDIQLLEEKSEQLQVTSQFKDDIIKEMRKELKLTRFKFGSTRPDFTSNADSEVQYKSSYANSSLLTSQTPQFSSIQSDKQQLNLHDTTQYSVDLQKQPIDASSSENILQKMYIPCNESQNLKFSLQQHIPERLANPNVEIKSSKLNSIKSLNVISSKHNYKCTGVESEGFILNLTNNMNVKKLLRKHSSSPPTRDG